MQTCDKVVFEKFHPSHNRTLKQMAGSRGVITHDYGDGRVQVRFAGEWLYHGKATFVIHKRWLKKLGEPS